MAEEGYTELKEKCIREGILFEDDGFPATDISLPEDILKNGKIDWLRPKDIHDDATLFHENPTKFDIKQGELGDCWFLGSMANLPKYESVFQYVFPPENTNFQDEDYCGIFKFRFWYYGQWVQVVIDDRLPTRDGNLIMVTSEHPNVFWSTLLEKAYAKLHGSYKRIVGGFTAESFEELTGGIGELFMLKDETSKLFDYIELCLENHCLIGCSTSEEKKDRSESHGIVDSHAYSLTGTKKISDEVLLVRIRNPWGEETEWKGAWSDGSSEWNTLSPEEIEQMQLAFDPDGEYWMNWEDFTKQFTEVEIGYLNPFCFTEKDASEREIEDSTVKMVSISGTWTSDDLYIMEEESDDKKDEPEETAIEEEKTSEGDEENTGESDEEETGEGDEEKTGESDEEETGESDEEETGEGAEEKTGEGAEEKTAEGDEEVVGDGEEETESSDISAEDLSKSLQYLIKINKPDEDEEDKKFKVVVCTMIKHRRQIDPIVLPFVNYDVYQFDKSQLSVASKLKESFFENNKPLKARWGLNCSEEFIGGFNLKAGEYALVLSSAKESEFFVRIYSSVDVQLHPLINHAEDENEIDF